MFKCAIIDLEHGVLMYLKDNTSTLSSKNCVPQIRKIYLGTNTFDLEGAINTSLFGIGYPPFFCLYSERAITTSSLHPFKLAAICKSARISRVWGNPADKRQPKQYNRRTRSLSIDKLGLMVPIKPHSSIHPECPSRYVKAVFVT